jgi:hypothetical protein
MPPHPAHISMPNPAELMLLGRRGSTLSLTTMACVARPRTAMHRLPTAMLRAWSTGSNLVMTGL